MSRFPTRNVRLLIHDTTGEIMRGLPLLTLPSRLMDIVGGYLPWAVGRDVTTQSDAEALVLCSHRSGQQHLGRR